MKGQRRSFCSWSGGKDCCMALYEAIRGGYRVELLISLLGENGTTSASHGLPYSLLRAQSAALGLEQLSFPKDYSSSEHPLYVAARDAVARGCYHGIFGDIFVESHREWIEKAAEACGFEPVFPLWRRPTGELARAFIRAGFRAMVVAVRKDVLGGEVLGRILDEDLVQEMEEKGIDPCGENGEYHTFVFDGPIFKNSVPFRVSGIREEGERLFLQLQAH
ncbi:MAG: diphthine--ammonia ligase [Candidatus Geothermincolales bacterium]